MTKDYVLVYRRKRRKQPRKEKMLKLPYGRQLERAKTPDSKALILAEEMMRNKNLKVTRRRVPGKLKKMVEKELGAKFELKPTIYMYEPKRGHKFAKRKTVDMWAGATHTPVKHVIEDGGPVPYPEDPVILMPKSTFKDKRVANTIVAHELAEALAVQEMLKMPTTHQQALKVEMKIEKIEKITRPEVLQRSKELFNDPESWK